jgi:periplasmic divalent cation tolerance protein
MELIAIITTLGNLDDARHLAKTLIERKLAACAHLNPIESYYYWDGALQHDSEVRVLFKCLKSSYTRVEAAIRELHPYELPAICAFDITQVNEAYGNWVAKSCEPA